VLRWERNWPGSCERGGGGEWRGGVSDDAMWWFRISFSARSAASTQSAASLTAAARATRSYGTPRGTHDRPRRCVATSWNQRRRHTSLATPATARPPLRKLPRDTASSKIQNASLYPEKFSESRRQWRGEVTGRAGTCETAAFADMTEAWAAMTTKRGRWNRRAAVYGEVCLTAPSRCLSTFG
jgi:hypothetical protein